jgi:transcriptional regulator with XRE-family HTH domain
MSGKFGINDAVRIKLRQLRKARKVTVRELCSQLGMPIGSYGCLESGSYNITLENLHKILGVLGADISEVWPYDTGAEATGNEASQFRKHQEFRLAEVLALSHAEGAALFALREGRCAVIMHSNLSEFLIDRLTLYLEDHLVYQEGLWFEKRRGNTVYYCFLKAQTCPGFVRKLLDRYLVLWASAFSE